MGSPFTITSVSNYNSNPPSDDGAQTAANRVQWSTHITKIGNPIKTAFDSSETATSTAFGKILGGAGITTTAVDYTVTASDQGKLVKVTASGKTITTPDATVVASPFVFSLLNNSTGDITIAGNGTQKVDGNATVTVPAGCGCVLNTDGSNWFSFGLNYNNVLERPQGYLTLTSGTPVIAGDVAAVSTVYYTPDQGDRIPITTDGVTFKMRQFSELTLTLVANHLATTLYDVFLFDNSGTTTVGTGPAWNSSTARGTGAGTTELQTVHGLYTNKNSMTARNGSTTYTVAANQGLYVGTLYIDSVAGQITCLRTAGQNRRWGVWNAFNRRPIILLSNESSTSWTVGGGGSGAVRLVNGNSGNNLTVHTGLAEEEVTIASNLLATVTATASQVCTARAAIGINSTSTASGLAPLVGLSLGAGVAGNISDIIVAAANYVAPPTLGVTTISPLEGYNVTGASAPTASGGANNNLMTAAYRG